MISLNARDQIRSDTSNVFILSDLRFGDHGHDSVRPVDLDVAEEFENKQ